MSIKEISTKLTSKELDRFLEIYKNRNCTPSDLIKKLVLSLIETSEKKQATKEPAQSQAKPQAAKTEQQASLNESTTIEIIKKIENNEVKKNSRSYICQAGRKARKNRLWQNSKKRYFVKFTKDCAINFYSMWLRKKWSMLRKNQ